MHLAPRCCCSWVCVTVTHVLGRRAACALTTRGEHAFSPDDEIGTVCFLRTRSRSCRDVDCPRSRMQALIVLWFLTYTNSSAACLSCCLLSRGTCCVQGEWRRDLLWGTFCFRNCIFWVECPNDAKFWRWCALQLMIHAWHCQLYVWSCWP